MKNSLKYFSLITQVGLTILFVISFFTIFGVYLDRKLKTNSIFTLIFVLLGCFAAMWTTYQVIIKALAADSEQK